MAEGMAGPDEWVAINERWYKSEQLGEADMVQVAVIGAGLIGRAWSIVFARAGFNVALWDP